MSFPPVLPPPASRPLSPYLQATFPHPFDAATVVGLSYLILIVGLLTPSLSCFKATFVSLISKLTFPATAMAFPSFPPCFFFFFCGGSITLAFFFSFFFRCAIFLCLRFPPIFFFLIFTDPLYRPAKSDPFFFFFLRALQADPAVLPFLRFFSFAGMVFFLTSPAVGRFLLGAVLLFRRGSVLIFLREHLCCSPNLPFSFLMRLNSCESSQVPFTRSIRGSV